jgi:hypothetical protein
LNGVFYPFRLSLNRGRSQRASVNGSIAARVFADIFNEFEIFPLARLDERLLICKKLRIILNINRGSIAMPCRKKPILAFLAAAAGGVLVSSQPVHANGATVATVRFSRDRFEPAKLTVPANQPFTIEVTNADKKAIEFESFDLHRERVVRPGQTITVYMAPTAPGHYTFCDDFDHSVAEGAIEAR